MAFGKGMGTPNAVKKGKKVSSAAEVTGDTEELSPHGEPKIPFEGPGRGKLKAEHAGEVEDDSEETREGPAEEAAEEASCPCGDPTCEGNIEHHGSMDKAISSIRKSKKPHYDFGSQSFRNK